MPDGQVLEFTNVTKRFNEVTAVSDFTARVEPGAVTAFLGPNGAGKTTSLRILLGQVRATSGTATIGGTTYAELRQPLRTIGSVLEETAYRPRRTANRQLTIAAKANGIPLSRVGEVLALVGLENEGDTRIGGYSLGMRQRLSVAHALLGDPGALVFDEPANGLDPEGIRWMRLLMRRLADEGRTVLVSSHVLSEVEQVADNVLVLSKGHLVLASGIEKLADQKAGSVVVDAADRDALTSALSTAGFEIEVLRSGLTVRGGDAGTVGAVAAAAGIALSTLVQRGPTLEDVFIDLVRGGRLGPRAEAAASQLVGPESTGGTPAVVTAVQTVDATEPAADESEAGEAGEAGETETDTGEAATAADAEDVAEDGPADRPADETETATDAAGTGSPSSSAPHQTVQVSLVEELTPEETSSEQHADAEAPRSFDEILFGTAPAEAAPAPADGPDSPEPHHSVAAIFADPAPEVDHETATREVETGESEAEVEAGEVETETGEAETGATGTGELTAETGEVEETGEVDTVGVEFFTELDESDAPAEGAASAEHAQEQTPDDAQDDPRSAAVSSMLAAAARAYYDDEPRDYPLDPAPAEESAQWSVASTGVIDTVSVPKAEEAEEAEDVAHSPEDHDAHSPEGHDAHDREHQEQGGDQHHG